MQTQASHIESRLVDSPLVDYAALRDTLAPRREGARPTLYVVSVPELAPEIPAATVDVAERNRQASLDFLHRLVMGRDEVR